MARGNRKTGKGRHGKRLPGTTRGQDISSRGRRLFQREVNPFKKSKYNGDLLKTLNNTIKDLSLQMAENIIKSTNGDNTSELRDGSTDTQDNP